MPSDPVLTVTQSLYLHARSHLPRDVSHAAALSRALGWARWLPRGWDHTTWDTADVAAVGDLASEEHLGRVRRVRARVAAESRSKLFPVPDGTVRTKFTARDARHWTLVDDDGRTIRTLHIVNATRHRSLREALTRDLPHEFLVLVMALPTHLSPLPGGEDTSRSFVAIVLDVRVAEEALAIVAASRAERIAAEKTLTALRRKRIAPAKWMARELMKRFRIVNDPGLGDAIEVVILQALSHGLIGSDSARIHLLIVGAPGQGKTLVLTLARVLALRSVVVQASDVTLAGLRGASRATADGWTQMPGIYARTHRGALVFPDAHGMKPRDVKTVATSLHGTMDRGIIGEGTSGTRERHALMALCMDANRAEDLGIAPDGRGRPRGAMIHEILSILSRMDGYIELASVDARAWDTSDTLLDTLDASESPTQAPAWMREMQVLVATLIDRHAVVSIPKSQRKALRAGHQRVREHVLARRDVFPDHGFLANRIAITRMKFAIALARGSDRGGVNASDLAEADRLTWLKVHSLEHKRRRDAESAVKSKPAREAALGGMEKRLAWYVDRFGGKEVTREAMAAEYEKENGEPLPPRMLSRDLATLRAARRAYGRWAIPRRTVRAALE